MSTDIKISREFTKKKKKKHSRNYLELWSMCVIPLIWIIVFKYLPMGGIIIAFKNYKFARGIFGSKWCGFKNFEIAFRTSDFAKVTWNTLSLNFMFIIVGTIAAILLAVLLFNLKSRTSTKIYQTVLITPNFLSWVIASYMVYAVLNPSYGLLNNFLQSIGIKKIDWYATPGVWPLVLLICYVWKHIGMSSVIYYAALMGLDSSLLEAADIDGANRWQKTYKIMIPEIIPIVVVLTILSIGGIFHSDFGLFYQVTRDIGALYSKTDVIDTYVFRLMRGVGDYGLSSAIGLMQSIVGCILVLVTNAVARKVDPDSALM